MSKFYDYKKRENIAVVVVTTHGAKGRCEVDADDLSLLRVSWAWTDSICNAEVLFNKECQNSSRTHQKIGAIQEAFVQMCGKNGQRPETQCFIRLPFPVRVQKECMKVTNIEGPVQRMVIELIADTGTQNSELVAEFSL